jgi:hypothetical protein
MLDLSFEILAIFFRTFSSCKERELFAQITSIRGPQNQPIHSFEYVDYETKICKLPSIRKTRTLWLWGNPLYIALSHGTLNACIFFYKTYGNIFLQDS